MEMETIYLRSDRVTFERLMQAEKEDEANPSLPKK